MMLGQPRVGTTGFRKMLHDLTTPLYEAKLLYFYRIQNDRDVVPKVPILDMGFVHVGRQGRVRGQG